MNINLARFKFQLKNDLSNKKNQSNYDEITTLGQR